MSHEKLLELCRYGSLAPSVHNTQPWRFRLIEDGVEILVAPDRILKGGDPTGRELWISLGACIENMVVAVPGLGFSLTKLETDFHKDFNNRPIATIRFKKAARATDKQWLTSIEQRVTDRSAFTPTPLSRAVQQKIERSYGSKTVKIVVNDKPELLELAGDLTTRALGMALGLPEFRAELNKLVHYNWQSDKVGMPGYTLNRGLLGSIAEKAGLATGWGAKRKAKEDGRLVSQGPALVMVFAQGDTPPYWLEAGRAYERAILQATAEGLHNATFAAVVEAGTFHEDIEQAVGVTWRLQTMARLGYPGRQKPRHSPRLPVEALLAT